MSLQEIKNQAYKLSVSDRLNLVEAIVQSLQEELRPRPDREEQMAALVRLRGIGKIEQPASTDDELTETYVDYLVEKYK